MVNLSAEDLNVLRNALDTHYSALLQRADAHPHPEARDNYHAEARRVDALRARVRAALKVQS